MSNTGFGFASVGHFFSSVASHIVSGARAATQVLVGLKKTEPEIEALTSLVYPGAVEIERGAFALLGLAADAVAKTGDAAAANGVNLLLDASTVAAVKALIPAIEDFAKKIGAQKPKQ